MIDYFYFFLAGGVLAIMFYYIYIMESKTHIYKLLKKHKEMKQNNINYYKKQIKQIEEDLKNERN